MPPVRVPTITRARARSFIAVLCGGLLVVLASTPVRAENALVDGAVTPASGTTATTFGFSVRYASSQPPRAATAVRAELVRAGDGATVTVALALVSGDERNGSWSGSDRVAAGTWQFTFHAMAEQGDDPTLAGGTIQVSAASAAPTASPTPAATPPASPGPIASVTPSPTPGGTAGPTPSIPAATARPATAAPPSGPTLAPPNPPAPGSSSGATPEGSSGDGRAPSASPTAPVSLRPHASGRASASPPGTPVAYAGAADPASADFGVPWILVGSGMATAGAAILGVQVIGLRRRRPR